MRAKAIVYLLLALPLTYCQDTKRNESEVIVNMPDIMAEFPGGHEKLGQFIRENFNQSEDQPKVEGKVYVTFIVTSKGEMVEAKIDQGLCETCDVEVLRLIESMPKWKPDQKDGRNVATRLALPVTFKH